MINPTPEPLTPADRAALTPRSPEEAADLAYSRAVAAGEGWLAGDPVLSDLELTEAAGAVLAATPGTNRVRLPDGRELYAGEVRAAHEALLAGKPITALDTLGLIVGMVDGSPVPVEK